MSYYDRIIDELNSVTGYPLGEVAAIYISLIMLIGEETVNSMVEHGDYDAGFDHFWFRFHKSLRQVDTCNTLKSTIPDINPNAHVDRIFWSFIHVDKYDVLRTVLHDIVPHDRFKHPDEEAEV